VATKTQPAERQTSALIAGEPVETLADFLHELGDIPPERVRVRPAVRSATEQDLEGRDGCELVDGTIVEKAVGFLESCLASLLVGFLRDYLEKHDIGFIAGPDALMRFGKNVRGPDVAFVRWERVPDEEIPDTPVGEAVPELVVEILSRGNSRAEIERKRGEYFAGGVPLVWIVEPRKRTVEVWADPNTFKTLTEEDVLDGGQVLPEFSLPVREWFRRARRRKPDG
jgi:Uma2 family endonuclease